MWKILCLFILFIIKTLAVKNTYQQYQAVPTEGPSPTINIGSPDLSEAVNYYDCFSIKDSKTCEGMDIYLPDTGVYYTTASSFDTYINGEINNDSGILMALCPNANIKHDLQRIAYRYSVFCGRFVYAQARWCPQNPDFIRANPKLSLCKSTCLEYAQSVADYGQTVCQNADNSIGEQIKQNIINKWCNLFTDESGCFKGTTQESNQCGYRSAIYASEAQTYNPNNSCFKENSEIIDILSQKATEEKSKEHKMGGIKWKIIYPIGIMFVVGGITGYFWKKQNEQFKLGYVQSESQNNNEDIVPSKVKPSREYVDEDFIKEFELEIPESSLLRNGSLSVNKYNETIRASSSNKADKSVIYMIAIYNYRPRREDELELHSGDRVRVEHEYEDGWGAGVNETTNKFGAFPLICCSTNITTNEDALPQRNKSRKSTINRNIRKRTTITSPLANEK